MNNKKIVVEKEILKNPGQESEKLAKDEAEDFSEEKLERETRKNDHNRKECAKKIVHWCSIALIFTLYTIVISGVIIFAHHISAPPKWYFISQDQFDLLKNLILSALATSWAKEFIKKNN